MRSRACVVISARLSRGAHEGAVSSRSHASAQRAHRVVPSLWVWAAQFGRSEISAMSFPAILKPCQRPEMPGRDRDISEREFDHWWAVRIDFGFWHFDNGLTRPRVAMAGPDKCQRAFDGPCSFGPGLFADKIANAKTKKARQSRARDNLRAEPWFACHPASSRSSRRDTVSIITSRLSPGRSSTSGRATSRKLPTAITKSAPSTSFA